MIVLIQSFSFRRTGYPRDNTGKGGGFVFDCRAIGVEHVEGSSVDVMELTGLDSRVIEVLDKDSDTQEFFRAIWTMVRLNLIRCLKRNFKVMTVNFGCTAGQHRSVYMAERLARDIRDTFPDVNVELNHIERPYWPEGIQGA